MAREKADGERVQGGNFSKNMWPAAAQPAVEQWRWAPYKSGSFSQMILSDREELVTRKGPRVLGGLTSSFASERTTWSLCFSRHDSLESIGTRASVLARCQIAVKY